MGEPGADPCVLELEQTLGALSEALPSHKSAEPRVGHGGPHRAVKGLTLHLAAWAPSSK